MPMTRIPCPLRSAPLRFLNTKVNCSSKISVYSSRKDTSTQSTSSKNAIDPKVNYSSWNPQTGS